MNFHVGFFILTFLLLFYVELFVVILRFLCGNNDLIIKLFNYKALCGWFISQLRSCI
jgi:hypothetical protein